MASPGWQRQKDVFQAALARAPELRGAFLDEACGGDDELRREVDRLLAAHDAAGGFLSSPIGLDTDGAEEAGAPDAGPQRIGPYQILDTIAHGGMGTVYRAVRDDDAFRKTVALKLVRGGRHSDYFERRFRQERQILARLQHPNIATVLDGGTTEDGQPYLVMEYVEGQPITELLRGAGTGDPGAAGPVPDGVRRRPVRPSEPGGPPRHQAGERAGGRSRRPEAARLRHRQAARLRRRSRPGAHRHRAPDDDARVREPGAGQGPAGHDRQRRLLAGRAALRAAGGPAPVRSEDRLARGDRAGRLRDRTQGAQRGRQRADRDDATGPAPRRSRPSCAATSTRSSSRRCARSPSGVIAPPTICRRTSGATSKGFPVTARADTIGYRAGKFVRRHRTAVAAAVLVSASLVGGIVTTTRQARLAQRRFDEARRLIHTVIFDIQPKMGAVPGTTALRKDLIESTLKYLEALTRDAGDNPALLRELAASYVQLARVQGFQGESNVGDTQAARRTLGEAEKLVERLLKLDPNGPESLHEAVSLERYLALSFLYEAAYAPGAAACPAGRRAGRAPGGDPARLAGAGRPGRRPPHARQLLGLRRGLRTQPGDLRITPPREAGRAAGAAEPVPGPQVRGRPPLSEGRGTAPASTSSSRPVRSTRSFSPPTPRTP